MISLTKLTELLIEHHLLKEVIVDNVWHYQLPEQLANRTINHITYDSRQIKADSLFFCKGLAFKQSYLEQGIQAGAAYYVSEVNYELSETVALGIIVTDIKKAMALISMAFYDYPQNDLKLIAYTGTKGKTTAAYFCKYILDEATNYKTALLSTMETVLDGVTPVKSLLTTPESVDLYRMMREAVTNGMSHLVMEVSSQAYKTERVYNLTFDVGVFLNISPDHIGAIEHPDFDDYFYCKRQLLKSSRQMIINQNSDHVEIIQEVAASHADKVITYGDETVQADYRFISKANNQFDVLSTEDPLGVAGSYQINLPGDFNQGNALSSVIATALVGAKQEAIREGLAKAKVAGRMEKLTSAKGVHVYIDYAHNFLSLQTLLSFVKNHHAESKMTVVIGSTGGKGVSRRKDFGKVLSELADVAILTTDDPGNEDPEKIISEISQSITDNVRQEIILDRQLAITAALKTAKPGDVVVLAGKGPDLYQLIEDVRQPYLGDVAVTEELIKAGF